MKITMITVAYGLPEASLNLISSFYRFSEHELSTKLFLHSTMPEVVAISQEATRQFPNVSVLPYGINRGLSNSWNEGMLSAYNDGADLVFIANDDIEFTKGDVDRLAQVASEQGRDTGVVGASGRNSRTGEAVLHGYSCFAILPQSIERVGCFDENIFPIYYEDIDHWYRGHLLGMTQLNCEGMNVLHGQSMAVRANPALAEQNKLTFARNQEYYLRKWGGTGFKEVFKTPFNDPSLSPYISPESRHAPYGSGYDRTDQGIVQF